MDLGDETAEEGTKVTGTAEVTLFDMVMREYRKGETR